MNAVEKLGITSHQVSITELPLPVYIYSTQRVYSLVDMMMRGKKMAIGFQIEEWER